MSKTLISRRLFRGDRLARGLLRASWTIVLAMLLTSATGCIIPTSLDAQAPPPNFAPVILTDRVTPPFGPRSFTGSDTFNVQLYVDDPDDNQPTTQDKLHARLFVLDQASNQLIADTPDSLLQSVQDPNDPTLYETTLSYTPCLERSGRTIYLYVIVADRPFKTSDPSHVVAGGGSDSNFWVITCT